MAKKQVRLYPSEAEYLGLEPKPNAPGRFQASYGIDEHDHDKIKTLRKGNKETITEEAPSEKTDITENEEGITIKYLGGKPLTSKEQAIKFFDIDTKTYEVVGFQCKSWPTTMKIKQKDTDKPVQVMNYGVTLTLKRKAIELRFDYKAKPKTIRKKMGVGSVVVPISDFHIGAYVGELLKTKNFSFDVLCSYLEDIANYVNLQGYRKVHLMMLGDFIESFTGLNHINSWKGLHKGSYGMSAVILAHEVLSNHLYSRIHNLESVDFVSGNHDRITSNNAEDVSGEVGKMLQYLFTKDYTIETTYSDLLVKRIVEGIGYLATHGHLGLSKKDAGKIVQDYGFLTAEYHVVLQGHKHARETKRHFKKSIARYEVIDVVQHDSLDYRKITVPPLFTGNFYSESLGYTSTAGFTLLNKNQFGKLNHLDVTL